MRDEVVLKLQKERLFKRIFAYLSVVSLLASLLTIIPIIASKTPTAEAADCSTASSNNLSATASHGQVFYIDSGVTPKVDASYVGYKINNALNNATRTGLWVALETFTGGKVGLANPTDYFQQLPTINASSSKTAFFLLKASGPTTSAQTHTVKVYDRRPDLANATALLTCTFSFSNVKETIKASANKVNTVTSTLSPATPTLGGTVVVNVTSANTGKVGQGSAPDNSLFWVSPAAFSTWPTRSLRLESTTVTLGCSGQDQTLTDTLVKNNAAATCFGNGAAGSWTAAYTFRIIGPGPSSLTPSPVAIISSGTQYKHSDIGGITSNTSINLSGVSSSAFSVSVTASSTVVSSTASNAVVEYTITMTTTSTTTVRVDELVDKRALNTTFVANSATLNGSGISDPVTINSESSLSPPPLHYIGPFSVVNTSATTLVYRMNVPCAAGSNAYTNVVYAIVGDQILGSTSTQLSAAVVTTITNGASCNVSTTTTTQNISATGQTYPASNETSDSGTGRSSARLNGFANAYGLSNITAAFRYSKDANLASNVTLTAQQSVTGSTSTAIYADVTNLDPGTTYFFRIEVGSVQGAILSFTTPAILAQPVVTTGSVSNIASAQGAYAATLSGYVNANLNTLTPIQFEYCSYNATTCNSTTMSASITTISVKMDDGSGTATNLILSGSGDYPVDTNNIDGSKQVSSLSSGTTYYYRTVAVCSSTVTTYCPNTSQKYYGSIRQFTIGVIQVTTTEATSVASTTATLNGTAQANGQTNQTWRFAYCAASATCSSGSLGASPTLATLSSSLASNYNASVTTNITSLTANTTYYYQTIGYDNGTAVSFGDILSFTTIAITTDSLPGGTKNNSYQASIAGSGGTGSYSFAIATGLPTGLTVSTSGLISGTPTVSGTYTFTVTMTETYYSTTTTKSLSIVIIEVVTSAASSITATTATLNGTSSTSLTTPKFCYSSSNPNGNFDAASCTSVSANETSPFSANLTGLNPSTTYWFQLTGISGGTSYYGSTETFTTLPSVTTSSATSISRRSATLNGTASQALTNPKFCYSTVAFSDPISCAGKTEVNASGSYNAYSYDASSLDPNTKYYFVLYGTVSSTQYTGSVKEFTTTALVSITLTADSFTKDYLAASPTFTFQQTSGTLIAGDAISGVTYTFTNAAGNTYAYNSTTVPTEAGAYTITPSAATFSTGSSSDYSITYATGTYTINKINQAALSLANRTLSRSNTYTLLATGGSGTGALSYSQTGETFPTAGNNCSIAGDQLTTPNENGTCSITATRAGDRNYNEITSSAATMTINDTLAQTITFTNPGNQTFSSTPFTHTASTTSGLSVTLTSNSLDVCTVTTPAVSAGYSFTITMLKAGTCSITATQDGGTDGNNNTYSSASPVTQSFTINAAAPTATTNAASSVARTTATLNGSITIGGASTTITFVYGTVNDLSSGTTTVTAAESPRTSNGDGSYNLTGLTAGTTYYFKIVATNSNSTVSGLIRSFTTTAEVNPGPAPTPPPPPPPPSISALSKTIVCAVTNDITIYGSNLEGAVVKLDGVVITIKTGTSNALLITLPTSSIGTKTLTVTTSYGVATSTINVLTAYKPKFLPIRIPYLSQGVAVDLNFEANHATGFRLDGKLPSGVTFNTQTGLISGTPTENGVYVFNLIAEGPCGDTTELVELDIDAQTPNAISHRINFLPGSCAISDSAKESFLRFIEKVKGISPRNIVPDIYVSGGIKLTDPNSPTAQCRQEAICGLLLVEDLLGEILTDVFTGSENRIEIIVYWERPSDDEI